MLLDKTILTRLREPYGNLPLAFSFSSIVFILGQVLTFRFSSIVFVLGQVITVSLIFRVLFPQHSAHTIDLLTPRDEGINYQEI